jgi:hypothetical protein
LVAVNIFRVKDGKLAEQWDVLQEEVPDENTANKTPCSQPTPNHEPLFSYSTCSSCFAKNPIQDLELSPALPSSPSGESSNFLIEDLHSFLAH